MAVGADSHRRRAGGISQSGSAAISCASKIDAGVFEDGSIREAANEPCLTLRLSRLRLSAAST